MTMRKYLFMAVFVSGLTPCVGNGGFSPVGAHFGMSNLSGACIIGLLILIYLAGGYFLGGYWADHSPSYRTFFQILIWAALSLAVIPLVSKPVLRAAADAFDQLNIGMLVGAFASVLVLLIVPVTLLGTASPFAIRLAIQQTDSVGKISGRIYAISTLGSFIGTFLPVLLLIPTIGTYRTFLVLSAILLLAALIGLWRTAGGRIMLAYLWTPLVLGLIWWLGLSGPDKDTAGMIYETESSYNYLQVLESNQYRVLRMNEGQGMHSVYHPTLLDYYGPWEMVLVAPYFNAYPYLPENVKSMAIVGLAAGTTARQATAIYGSHPNRRFEIDQKVGLSGGRLDMNEPISTSSSRMAWGLEHSTKQYQFIRWCIPPTLYPLAHDNAEFFQIVRQHLTQDVCGDQCRSSAE